MLVNGDISVASCAIGSMLEAWLWTLLLGMRRLGGSVQGDLSEIPIRPTTLFRASGSILTFSLSLSALVRPELVGSMGQTNSVKVLAWEAPCYAFSIMTRIRTGDEFIILESESSGRVHHHPLISPLFLFGSSPRPGVPRDTHVSLVATSSCQGATTRVCRDEGVYPATFE